MASPALLDDGLSSQCLLETPQLSCRRQDGPDNTSRLVCASSDGQERATDMYAVLVALSVLIVPLAVLFNLAVVVTVYLNRRLHTVINVLVTVLCMNNVMWTGMPILCVFAVNFIVPLHCTLRSFFYLATRHICFSVIVIITVLRYLLVVKNRSFPADRKNTYIFIFFAVGPSLLKFYLRGFQDHSKCRKALAWSPDGYTIIGIFRNPVSWVSVAVVSTEYISGLLVIAFCYVRILIKIFLSKRRLKKRRDAALARAQQRPPRSISSQHSQAESSQERSIPRNGNGQERHTTTLENMMRMVRRHNATKTAPSCPAEPGPSRLPPTHGRNSVLPAPLTEPARIAGHTQSEPPGTVLKEAADVAGESAAAAQNDGSSQPVPAMLLTEPQPPSVSSHPDTDDGSATSASSTSRMKPSQPPQERSSTSRDRDIDHIASNNLILQPTNLLRVGPFHSASGRSTSSASTVALRERPRRPANQPAARVDIVATVSMTAFILIFFVVVSPLWTLQLVNKSAECVILPTMRIFLYIILIVTGGVAAIASPFVLVLFSGDFRQALRDTFRRLTQ